LFHTRPSTLVFRQQPAAAGRYTFVPEQNHCTEFDRTQCNTAVTSHDANTGKRKEKKRKEKKRKEKKRKEKKRKEERRGEENRREKKKRKEKIFKKFVSRNLKIKLHETSCLKPVASTTF